MQIDLGGSGVALVTPFKEDRSVDFDGLRKLVRYQIVNGTNYLVIMGTTGESATLNEKERFQIFDEVLAESNGVIPIIAGFGGNDTRKVKSSIKRFHFQGISAILSVSPYYNKPRQEGLFQHYMEIADAAPCPVILYNVPARTSSNINSETTLRLAHAHENIIGIKEASANVEQCMQIINGKPDDFQVVSGDDILTLPFMSIGMTGVISVLANAFPSQVNQLTQYCKNGSWEAARAEHYKLLELMNLQMAQGNPAGIKAIMQLKGLCKDYMRLPLVNADSALYERIKNALTKMDK